MNPTVLVADDDAGVRYTLREILEGAGIAVAEAVDGAEAVAWLERNTADLVITDLQMPRLDGMSLLARVRAMPAAPGVVMITAHGSERHAVEAMKRGALDYFAKPFDVDAVLRVVARAVSATRLDRENEQLRAELHLARHMVFASDAMRRVALLVHRVAPKDVSVLITGPSGTGKERVAEALVAGSPRAAKPFVRFNCAAIPRELAEAELFGHARGAFTNALRARPGLFREADGGTLLIDEAGELDPYVQGKLLRTLQEGTVRPVGEDRDVRVDVRVLAATHRDLAAEVAAGRFREDLLYRLRVVTLRLPPLAERPADIGPLVDHFLRRHAERFGIAVPAMTAGLRARLETAPWRGNVRELEHDLERRIALMAGDTLDDDDAESEGAGGAPDPAAPRGLREQVEAYERELLRAELERCGGNRSEAARRLRMGRVTLLDKLKKYGLGEP